MWLTRYAGFVATIVVSKDQKLVNYGIPSHCHARCNELIKPGETITGDQQMNQLFGPGINDNTRSYIAKVIKYSENRLKWKVPPHLPSCSLWLLFVAINGTRPG